MDPTGTEGTYRGTSPQMVGFGTLILEALPPD